MEKSQQKQGKAEGKDRKTSSNCFFLLDSRFFFFNLFILIYFNCNLIIIYNIVVVFALH